MFDAISPSELATLPPPQRAEGKVRLAFRRRGAASALHRHYEQGALKARLPRAESPGLPQAVLMNTAGGLAGGDRLATEIAVGEDAAAVVSTQAAERIYRSEGPAARVETRLALERGARLDWLPQETIVFDRGRLERSLEVEMAADAELVASEAILLGREAMGESVVAGRLIDRWRIRRAGRLVFADALRLDGEVAALVAGHATLGGARAVATVVRIAPLAESLLGAARAALDNAGHAAGASAQDGMLVARLVAPDGFRLRRTLVALLAVLRQGRTLPRVWSC